eukprot:m.414124 g.414124  ORF g.414124 m.414124 type:complete len:193 (+) comp21267_c0_seq8:150-728(+)
MSRSPKKKAMAAANIEGDMAKTRTAPCMHLLPCGIEASGRASVAEYFEPVIQPEDIGPVQLTTPYTELRKVKKEQEVHREGSGAAKYKGNLTAAFRGRRLKGRRIQLPKGYQGVVLRTEGTVHSDDQGRTWRPANKFDNFTYWNMDSVPSNNDPVVQALEWVKIARAVHEPSRGNLSPRRSPRKSPRKDYRS